MLAEAAGKIDEAKFFHGNLTVAQNCPNLEEASIQFDNSFSAFLTASRSAIQIIADQLGWPFIDNAVLTWTEYEQEVFRSFRTLRNDCVHRGEGKAVSVIDFVPTWQAFQGRRDFASIYSAAGTVGPPSAPSPMVGVRRFTLQIGTRCMSAVDCCQQFLKLTERLFDAATTAS